MAPKKESISKESFIFDKKKAEERCLQYRLRILEISQKVPALHIAPAFSCLEIVDSIYYGLIQGSKNSKHSEDVFIMSKGHGCITQYVILESLGVLKKEHLDSYCTPSGILGAHPDIGNPGIHASTGSLGHGLGLGVGIAYAEKLKSTNKITHILVSDGELQEGSSWEAAMMAANLELENLIIYVDLNDFGGMHRMSKHHKAFYPLKEKFESFGWEAKIVDGHKQNEILNTVYSRKSKKPFVLICNTVKGKGVSYMENVPIWHYRSPNNHEYKLALAELKEGGR
jgi:transketolase